MLVKVKVHRLRAKSFELLSNDVFLVERAVEKHIAPAPSPRDLASQGAVCARRLVQLVDVRVADRGGHALLVDPGFVEQGAQVIQPALQQGVLEVEGDLLELVHRAQHIFAALHISLDLGVDDPVRAAGLARVAEQQAVVQLVEHVGRDTQRVDDGRVPGELDKVKAPKGRRVLILLAAFEPQVHAFDLVGQVGDLVVGERQVQPAMEQADERYYQRGRGAEARSRRRVAVQKEIEALVPALLVQAMDHGFDQEELVIVVEGLVHAVLGDNVIVERGDGDLRILSGAHRSVGVLVDGGAQHDAPLLRDVGLNVGAASGKADPQRRFAPNDHRLFSRPRDAA